MTLPYLRAHLPGVEEVTDRALLALQGPEAEAALAALLPGVAENAFSWTWPVMDWKGAALWLSRSGYTGEDGFELSVPVALAEEFRPQRATLLRMTGSGPLAGWAPRDSLRLEAGLPLYGQEMDTGISPVEAPGRAGPSARPVVRAGRGRAGFRARDVILDQTCPWRAAPPCRIAPRGPCADCVMGVPLFADAGGGDPIGQITSGGFGPSVGAADSAIGLILTPPCPLTPTPFTERSAAKRLPSTARRCRCPSCHPVTNADTLPKKLHRGKRAPMKYTEDHEWLDADGDIVTVAASPNTPRPKGWATWCVVELPEVGDAGRQGATRSWLIEKASRAASDIVAPTRRRDCRDQRGASSTTPALVNEGPDRRGVRSSRSRSRMPRGPSTAFMDRGRVQGSYSGNRGDDAPVASPVGPRPTRRNS